MRKSTTPKGVVSSLTSLPRVGCVALANPALSKVQPRWGRGTLCGLMEIGRDGLRVEWLVSFGWIARRLLVSFLLKIIMKFMAKNFALIKNILIFGESKEVFSAA